MTEYRPLESVLKEARQKLEKLERVQAIRTAQFENQLTGAGGYARPHIQLQFDEWKISSASQIDDTKFQIEDLEQRIQKQAKETRDQARAELDLEKQKAQAAWLENAGTQESFDLAWPAMEMEYLKQKTLESMGPSFDDLVRRKTEQMGGL